eukprot:1382297-Rhodomonas_salina.2
MSGTDVAYAAGSISPYEPTLVLRRVRCALRAYAESAIPIRHATIAFLGHVRYMRVQEGTSSTDEGWVARVQLWWSWPMSHLPTRS